MIILCNKEQTKVLDLCEIFFVCADPSELNKRLCSRKLKQEKAMRTQG